tara:strand:- start:13857 stop:14180 length:324 start_codon:yes stop_codon:yes gene_type:complete
MTIDLSDDAAGRATAFATGCAATWVFVRNMVMKPAIKSCHQRCSDLEVSMAWLKDQLVKKDTRIEHLEMALYSSGIPELRKAMQGAISETRFEARVATDALERKIEP